jgi:mannose/cellobiose epimerase-like protein (N-acyl-D-glucosamine 2-epimerase family)
MARLSADKKEATMTAFGALKDRAQQAKSWLFDAALPLWWNVGFDRSAGCFHERIGHDGKPVILPRRIRVQARQTFVYAMAGNLGWTGPWREAAGAGADVLLGRGLRDDGGTNYQLDETGLPKDKSRDLYDAAFVAFALAHAARMLGRRECLAAAEHLLDWTFDHWSHPKGGLMEGDLMPVPPRRQNPHMHILEALLATVEAGGDKRHLDRAGRIVDLFGSKFAKDGVLLEFFDEAWTPAQGDEGRITEPGHQFEWAWLLDRYARATGTTIPAVADRIYAHGEDFGVDRATGVTVDEVWANGSVRTPTSRFWPHTERIKVNVIRAERGDVRAAVRAVQAFDVLMGYCSVPINGLWRDRRHPDGSFVEEAAPASSFYHAMLAFAELIRVTERLPD